MKFKPGDVVVQVSTGRKGVVFDYQGKYDTKYAVTVRFYDYMTHYFGNTYHGVNSSDLRRVSKLEKVLK